MPLAPNNIIVLSERYGAGEAMSEAEIDDLRGNVEPTTWLNLCRIREAAISAKGPAEQRSPYPEGAQVRLKSGGPAMTVEMVRPDEPTLVQAVWFDGGEARHRVFHKDALDPVAQATDVRPGGWRDMANRMVLYVSADPATAKAIERLQAWCDLGGSDCLVADLRLALARLGVP